MKNQLTFLLNRLKERLWIKPLLVCLVSVIAALLADLADSVPTATGVGQLIPEITRESIEDLLKITAASMLVIATFSVSSMVSAYASAANTATPRTFSLIIADDVSQNALSTFIGVFIFSIVALVALMNGYYGKLGRFCLFALTLTTLALVIVTFVRWVDKIARLGRLGTVIDKVELATAKAMQARRASPTLRGMPILSNSFDAQALYARTVGYVQQVDIERLQQYAEKQRVRIQIAALPGAFATPDNALAYVISDEHARFPADVCSIEQAFVIGQDRLFEDDPRFGLVVLSEIASRALSPAVNDPGTAIDIIGTYVRLFVQWAAPPTGHVAPAFDRVYVPELSIGDMFDDAFTSIARDGAALVEVQVRLQKALRTIAACGDETMRHEAIRHAQSALTEAERSVTNPAHLELIRRSTTVV